MNRGRNSGRCSRSMILTIAVAMVILIYMFAFSKLSGPSKQTDGQDTLATNANSQCQASISDTSAGFRCSCSVNGMVTSEVTGRSSDAGGPCPPCDCSNTASNRPAATHASSGGREGARQLNPILRHLLLNVDKTWDLLLENHPNPKAATVVEVGAADCQQATNAAKLGYRTIVLEPSPPNYRTCQDRGQRELGSAAQDKKRWVLLNEAASNETGTVYMNSVGSTGDHVGRNTGEINDQYKHNQLVSVRATTLDTVFKENSIELAYIVKIDTQGFDIAVLQGMAEIIRQRRAMYIMFELWPKAINTLTGLDPAVGFDLLNSAGYQVMDFLGGTFKGVEDSKGTRLWRTTKFDNIGPWMHSHDKRHGDSFGYWTDVIAAAPLDDKQMLAIIGQ